VHPCGAGSAIGETPTAAVGTTALPNSSLRIGGFLKIPNLFLAFKPPQPSNWPLVIGKAVNDFEFEPKFLQSVRSGSRHAPSGRRSFHQMSEACGHDMMAWFELIRSAFNACVFLLTHPLQTTREETNKDQHSRQNNYEDPLF
jgi:hypothetical protein